MRYSEALLYFVATIPFTGVANAFQSSIENEISAQPVATKRSLEVITRWNVRYGEESEPAHVGDLYYPKAIQNEPMRRIPAVLMIHGGAWSAGNKFHVSSHAKKLAARGFVVFSINYRLAPRFPFPSQLDDCKLALRWLQNNSERLQIDTDKVGVWGYSAGGHLASLLALQQSQLLANDSLDQASAVKSQPELVANEDDSLCTLKVAACVCGGTPFDLVSLAGKSAILDHVFVADSRRRVQSLAEASPTGRIHRQSPPFFLFHGRSDFVVPISQSEAMTERLKSHDIEFEFVALDGLGHLSAFIAPQGFLKSFDFLERILRPDSSWLEEHGKGE